MKLQIVSDLHLENAPLEPFEVRGDILIIAGDTHATPDGYREFFGSLPAQLPVVTVLGNHEFDNRFFPTTLPAYRQAVARFANIHLLENENIEIAGVTFTGATLWSDMWKGEHIAAVSRLLTWFGMQDVSVGDLIRLHRESVRWLETAFDSGKTVVVTHMAPSYRSIHAKYVGSQFNGFFASDLDWLIEKLQPPFWIHGHMHDDFDYHIGSTRVVCHPRGYPGENPGWDPLAKVLDI